MVYSRGHISTVNSDEESCSYHRGSSPINCRFQPFLAEKQYRHFVALIEIHIDSHDFPSASNAVERLGP